jgi:hypothetical protein
MTTLPPNITAYRDRFGKTRYRFRRKGLPARSLRRCPLN